MNDIPSDATEAGAQYTRSTSAAPRARWFNQPYKTLWMMPVVRAVRAWGSVFAASLRLQAHTLWTSPNGQRLRAAVAYWRQTAYSGFMISVGGITVVTAALLLLERVLPAPNPGVLFLPLAAFVAYYWNLRYGLLTAVLALFSVYFVLITPSFAIKPLTPITGSRLLTDTAVLGFILALARFAARRRERAEREASRFASLTSIGMALSSELDEEPLLRLIAETACELTGAGFAAFTLRPVDSQGQPIVPSRGDLFHLAAVVGVSPEQEEMFRRTPLGGEGLLAPIFRHAHSVRVVDALAMTPPHSTSAGYTTPADRRAALKAARNAALAFARGEVSYRELKGVGIPGGHPTVRSFLGAPLLDRSGNVRGGLLLGHSEPDRFTEDDERLLVGLASQAATALENARLYSASQTRARELDGIFDTIADGVALVALDGTIIRENRAARDLRANLDGGPENSSTLINRLVARATDQAIQEISVLANEPLLQITTPQHERREYLMSAAPVRAAAARSRVPGEDIATSEELIGAVIVWRDVTETRQLIVERRAREDADAQRLLLQTVVDELPSGVFLAYGPDARLILANRAALNVWGAEWQPGQPMLDFFHKNHIQALRPDGQPFATDELATIRSVRTGEAIHHHEEVIRQRNGTHLPVLLNTVTLNSTLLSRALRDDVSLDPPGDGDYTAIVVLQDVTSLKEAERLKDEFIAMAAHELKTPMSAVKGYAEMLARGPANGLGAPLEDWQREALESIDSSTIRLVELTNDLLDVARLQADRLELRREPTDLIALARRVCRRMQITTERHHLLVESREDYVVADVDSPRMEQVLGNLLGNAIKYSPDGGDVLVNVNVREDGEHALITVRDHGIGIPKDQQGRLFSRFVRADNARERSIAGTGLGLYLCREILTRHGGRIWLDSQLNEGSVFSVELPLTASDPEEEDGESSDGIPSAPLDAVSRGVPTPTSEPQHP